MAPRREGRILCGEPNLTVFWRTGWRLYMKTNTFQWGRTQLTRYVIAIACALLLAPGDAILLASQAQQTNPQESVKIPPDQLDALVSPIALFPDPLLSQTLVASTYPLEIIQLQQWLTRNSGLKDQAL